MSSANREFGDRTLTLFDNSKSGPLSIKELHDIRLATMPYLLEDGRKSDLALLIARLIETVDAEKASRKNGAPVSIEAEHIVGLPDDKELPTAEDVRGILRS
jgi:hypothetical protein